MGEKSTVLIESSSSPKKPIIINPMVKELIIVFLILMLFLSVVLFPFMLFLNSRTITQSADGFYFWVWREWLAGELMETYLHQRPFSIKDFIYYGIIANGSVPETGNVADLVLISYPLRKIFSFPLYFNIKILIILFFNGMAGYYAVKRWTGCKISAFLSSLFLALNPYVFLVINRSRLREGILGFLLLFIFYLWEMYKSPTWRNSILTGIFLALTSMFYWFFGMFAVGIGGIFFLGVIIKNLIKKDFKILADFTVKGMVSLIPTMILFGFSLLPYSSGMIIQNDTPFSSLPFPDPSYLVPQPGNNQDMYEYLRSMGYRPEMLHLIISQSLPFNYIFSIVFTLSAVPAILKKRKFFFYLGGIFVLFYILGFGPYLMRIPIPEYQNFVYFGDFIPPMPYKLVYQFFVPISRLHHPSRFVAVSVVVLALLGGWGIREIISKIQNKNWMKYILFGVIFISIVHSLYFNSYIDTTPVFVYYDIPQFYKDLSKNNENFNLIELPNRMKERAFIYQSFHNRKILWSEISGAFDQFKMPDGKLKTICRKNFELEDNPFVKFLKDDFNQEEPDFVINDIKAIKSEGYRYILVHERHYYREPRDMEDDKINYAGFINLDYKNKKSQLTKYFGQPQIFQEQMELVKPVYPLRHSSMELYNLMFEVSVFDMNNLKE